MGAKIIIGSLLALLVAAGYLAYQGWVSQSDVEVPVYAFVALGLGAAFTLLVGGGLMALVFYSDRKGYDERAGRDRHGP
jgi:hypothetical protein